MRHRHDPHDRIRGHLIALGHPEAATLTDDQIDRAANALGKAAANAGISMARFGEVMLALSRGITKKAQ